MLLLCITGSSQLFHFCSNTHFASWKPAFRWLENCWPAIPLRALPRTWLRGKPLSTIAIRAVVSLNEFALHNELKVPGFAVCSRQQQLPGNYTEAHSPLMKCTSFTFGTRTLVLNRNENVFFLASNCLSHICTLYGDGAAWTSLLARIINLATVNQRRNFFAENHYQVDKHTKSVSVQQADHPAGSGSPCEVSLAHPHLSPVVPPREASSLHQCFPPPQLAHQLKQQHWV